MPVIATLTMNPTIDVAYEVGRVVPTHKIRTRHEYYNPGGGGINVARVFVRLGGNARCIYLSGGPTGVALDGLIDLHRLVRTRIPISGNTRIAMTALEGSSGKEYRFTPEGPTLSEPEWTACLDTVAQVACDWFVASGSLPPGVPDDFYARVARILAKRGIPMVLDTSGEALRHGLAGGGIALVKPSRGELETLVDAPLADRTAVAEAALALATGGKAQLVAVTMGHEGAILAHAGGVIDLPALPIEAKSAVGAGDSFVAGFVHALAQGEDPAMALRWGVAAGTAAVLHPGTALARPEDIRTMLAMLSQTA